MSKEFIETSLDLLKDDLVEYIKDENLDMLEEFPEEEIADIVLAVALKLMDSKVITYPLTSCGGIWNYQIKVNNNLNGFVSVSCEETGCTGVSKTEYFPFFHDDEDGYYSGLCCLAGMINEAWYFCNK